MVKVRKGRRKGCPYELVEISTGAHKACSKTRRAAEISASIRNRAVRQKRQRSRRG